jgi:hypothetical protein
MISGAGRLAAGVMQLVLPQRSGCPRPRSSSAFRPRRPHVAAPLGPLAPWIGGALQRQSAVCRALDNAQVDVLVLYVASAGQVIGGLFFGSTLSGSSAPC